MTLAGVSTPQRDMGARQGWERTAGSSEQAIPDRRGRTPRNKPNNKQQGGHQPWGAVVAARELQNSRAVFARPVGCAWSDSDQCENLQGRATQRRRRLVAGARQSARAPPTRRVRPSGWTGRTPTSHGLLQEALLAGRHSGRPARRRRSRPLSRRGVLTCPGCMAHKGSSAASLCSHRQVVYPHIGPVGAGQLALRSAHVQSP